METFKVLEMKKCIINTQRFPYLVQLKFPLNTQKSCPPIPPHSLQNHAASSTKHRSFFIPQNQEESNKNTIFLKKQQRLFSV